MKKTAKLRTVLLFAAACLFITVLGIALREKKQPVVVSQDMTPATEADVNLQLNNVAYSTLGSDNFKQWDLNARTARFMEDGTKVVLEELKITFYQRSGEPYQLSGAQGKLDMETRNIHISGNVQAVLPDNATITTNSAFYDNARRIITTNDPITITRGASVMQGVGMIADLNKETFSILSNVKVIGNR